jgi:tetratricopeptide (TPR) repeat protein/cold shock CspA family protein
MSSDLHQQARQHMQQNEWPAAIQLLEQARLINPQDITVMGDLAFCYSRSEQYPKAIELYGALCELQKDMARWPYSLGYQYYAQQQYAQAIPHFDRALEIKPDYIVVLYRKGYALSQLKGKEGQALTILERCREAFQALPDGDAKDQEQKHYADACFQQGKLFLKLRNYRLAGERLQEVAHLAGDDAGIQYNLGKLYVETDRYDEAIDCLKTARRLSKQPQHYILDYLGRAYTGAGRLQEAIQVYEQMPQNIRSRAYILRNMGDVYAQLEQMDKAESVLREAVKREYRNHNGHYRLGQVYQRLGKFQQAAQEFKKAIELRQNQYSKDFPEAEESLQALLTEHPEIEVEREVVLSSPPVSSSGRPVGCVKKYFDDRGYGFLEVEGQRNDLFFHITEVVGRDSVSIGEYLEYSVGEGKDGRPCATDLKTME